jgi:hypothetical protein
MVAILEASEAKTEANHEELMAIMKASQERDLMDASLEQMKACLVVTEARNRRKPKLRLAWKK